MPAFARMLAHDSAPLYAGALITDPSGAVLLMRRKAPADHAGEWATPGGKIEKGETPAQAMRREVKEETGHDIEARDEVGRAGGYVTYGATTRVQFAPLFNEEHDRAGWFKRDALPTPLHPGLKATLESPRKGSGPKAQDAETKHDPANGQFTSGSGSGAEEKDAHLDHNAMGEFSSETRNNGVIEISYSHGGKEINATVEPIGNGRALISINNEAGDVPYVNELGPTALRDFLFQFSDAHPEITELGGLRTTGARADRKAMTYIRLKKPAQDSLALDRASVRTYDKDGRLHVARTHISKANVCPYYGREIPDYEQLGLDAGKQYRLYRDPDELAKAAATFNNLQLLSKHQPVTVDAHAPELIVGSLGTDAQFTTPYLDNSLVIWARDALDGVESEEQVELSSAYRYRADMTPGKTPDGQTFDGIMRDIVGNHVALVREGRAGSDVVVGDSKPRKKEFTRMTVKTAVMQPKAALAMGVLLHHISPLLAQDEEINIRPALKGVTAKNFKQRIPKIAADVARITKGKLVEDADLGDVADLLGGLQEINAPDLVEQAAGTDKPEPLDPDAPPQNIDEDADPMNADPGDDPMAKVMAYLQDKLSPEDLAAVQAMCQGEATDEDPDDKRDDKMPKKPFARDTIPANKTAPIGVTRGAMDAALAKARKDAASDAVRTHQEIRAAERAVRPYVGDLPELAADSAEDVYRTALEMLGEDVEGVHPSAYSHILAKMPTADARATESKRRPAMDSRGAQGFAERFPNAARLQNH